MELRGRFPWIGVSAVAACLVVAVTAWLQIPDVTPRSEHEAPMPVLVLSRVDDGAVSDVALAEQLTAYDPTPLFLPSEMSSSASLVLGESDDRFVSPFKPITPTLTKTGPLVFSSTTPLPKNAVAGLGLTERADAPLAIGRADHEVAPLPARLARVEALDPRSGRTVLAFDLEPSPQAPAQGWQPLELVGAVSEAATIGDLVVTVSSGVGEVDDFYREHLKETARIGALLPRGFYLFRVGP